MLVAQLHRCCVCCVSVLEEHFPPVYSALDRVIFFLWPLSNHLSHCSIFCLLCGSNLFSCVLSCPPLWPSLSSFPLSGWNCGRGHLGLCRRPSLLPWWCSASTRCPPAAVTIGDRQVHQVLLRTPLPTPQEVNYTVAAEVQHMFPEPVAAWVVLVQEEHAVQGLGPSVWHVM